MPPTDPSDHPRWRRVGVLGGTFDPPHVGHLATAIEVREALGLDVVLLVVANDPWQKSADRRITPARTRLEMVRAAVAGEPGLAVSDVELRRGGPSYSADTLAELRGELAAGGAEPELFLVVGSDAAAGLGTWERVDELRAGCTLVVVDRPGAPHGDPPHGFDVARVTVPGLDVSSSRIRERVCSGRSIRYLVPDAVISLIREGGLYAGGR